VSERRWVGRDEERQVEMECVCERERERCVWWERQHHEICEGRLRLRSVDRDALESFQPGLLV
jgi:hypothetical protein